MAQEQQKKNNSRRSRSGGASRRRGSANRNTSNAGSFKGVPERATFGQILDALKETYCGWVGVEYMYINNITERRWVQARIEPIHSKGTYTAGQKLRLLERLTAAETLERYLHTRYVGQKRFSLEGGESLIVALDEVIRVAGGSGIDDIVVGMAHRGRLNVLVNTLGKAPAMLFDEFEGKKAQELTSGDVKYHLGSDGEYTAASGRTVRASVAANPSHLEAVDPVVQGIARAKNDQLPGSGFAVMPVLMHGDASFAGQGVIYETLQMSQLVGYRNGGTVHLVVNNQIGFTTGPADARSSLRSFLNH